MLRWFETNGKESDVVISSRVRLARNVKKYNFSLTNVETNSIILPYCNLQFYKTPNFVHFADIKEQHRLRQNMKQ